MGVPTATTTASEIEVEPASGEAPGDVDIAAVAALMADRSRAAVLIELTDGRALPPSELAEVAGVSRSTISEHLAKLERAGFLTVVTGGRNRYFRLAGPEIATAVESLAALAPRFTGQLDERVRLVPEHAVGLQQFPDVTGPHADAPGLNPADPGPRAVKPLPDLFAG